MYPLLLWVLPSLVLGFLGRHRALGFMGFFAASLIVSPVLVFILLLLTRPVRPEEQSAPARSKAS